MAETAAGGCERSAARSAASTRLAEWAIGTFSAGSGPTFSSTRASASATESNAMSVLGRLIEARLAAALLDKPDRLDAHAALERLGHVVDCEAGDRHRRERLHLDAGAARHFGGGPNGEAGQVAVRLDLDLDLGQRQRMAERDELMRALRREDAGDARRAEHVALPGVASEHGIERLGQHHHAALGDRHAL